MRRFLAAIAALFLLGGVAAAQPTLPAVGGAPPPAAEPAPADLEALIATLEDPGARAQLVAKLKALAETAPAEAAPADPFAGAVGSLSETIAARTNLMGEALLGVVRSVGEIPALLAWIWSRLTDPSAQAVWWAIIRQTGLGVLAGIVAGLAVRLLLRGWRDRLATLPFAAPRTARLKASAAHLVVNLAALATFLGVTYAVLAYGPVSLLARRVAGDILTAIALGRGLRALSQAAFAPENPRRRLVRLDDAAALHAHGWLHLLGGLAIYGYFLLRAAQRLGLPWTVHGFLLHLLFLIVAVLVIVLIYRLRAQLRATIERWGKTSTTALVRYLPWQTMARIGHHLLAGWVALVYLVWTLGVPGGALLLTRGLVVSIGAVLAVRALDIWLDRTFFPRPPASEEGTEAEPERPTPLRAAGIVVLRLLATLLAVAVALQAWGFDVVGWLQTGVGRAVLASLSRIAVVLGLVALLAKTINLVAARYIEAADSEGRLIYSNRTRTLASLARNLALAVLIMAGAVSVLAELGVDATALLAGAGVVGLAIGFGSQRLVQDLITGLFILLGDTVRVGDIVDLGGKAGVVEAISMRTVTLRDYNGNVHTIPYSSINVVTNMTKDYSCWVIDLRIAYKEDVDRVVEVLRDIDSQLRREWPYRRLILEPIEIAGVDALQESAVILKARTKVRPGEQWKVGRELNRRIKKRFDELGIEIPLPQQAVRFDADQMPPPFIEQRRREVQKDAAAEPPPRVAGGG